MADLQLKIDGVLDPEIFPDFGAADKAIRARTKAKKIPETADVRIVQAKPKGTEQVTVQVPDTRVVVRETFVRAPHHNVVMTGVGLFGLFAGIPLGMFIRGVLGV